MTDLLGVEIHRSPGRVHLSQPSYVDKLVGKWFPDGPPEQRNETKVPAGTDLPQLVADALTVTVLPAADNIRAYQSLVGALIYASVNTRPDVAYAIGMLCRAMAKPTQT